MKKIITMMIILMAILNAEMVIDDNADNIKRSNKRYMFEIHEERIIKFDLQTQLRYVNNFRSKGSICGNKYYPPVPPVEINDGLLRSSAKKSYDMAMTGVFSHNGSDQITDEFPFTGGQHVGIMILNELSSSKYMAENLDKDPKNLYEFNYNMMMNTQQCINTMNPHYQYVGFFAYRGYDNHTYWTEHFSGE